MAQNTNTDMWAIFAQLAITEGFKLASVLMEKWLSGKEMTIEDVTELRGIQKQTATDRARQQLILAGIDLNSEQAKQLLSLTTS